MQPTTETTALTTAARVQAELWTSWASVLRSYAAVHGLHATQHAVVEVSRAEITLRVGPRWLRFTPAAMEGSEQVASRFALHEDGTVSVGDARPEQMDLAAEQLARAMFAAAL